MRGTVHESRFPHVALFELLEIRIDERAQTSGRRIPAAVGSEPRVKEIEPAQLFHLEVSAQARLQLVRVEEMRAQRQAPSIRELDLAPVLAIVLVKMPHLVERIDEDSRRAS